MATPNLDDAILKYLEKREIRDQAELLALLEKQGFELTLSTLSRRMKKLEVRKQGGVYRRQDARQMGAMTFTLHKVPPCLIVIRTHSGYAQALALMLDEARLPDLAGTVAGDDTIFAAPVHGSRLDHLEAEIRRRLG